MVSGQKPEDATVTKGVVPRSKHSGQFEKTLAKTKNKSSTGLSGPKIALRHSVGLGAPMHPIPA